MDVHREGGRREDGGDVAEAAAGSTLAMRMTTPRVDEEGHTDASNIQPQFTVIITAMWVSSKINFHVMWWLHVVYLFSAKARADFSAMSEPRCQN